MCEDYVQIYKSTDVQLTLSVSGIALALSVSVSETTRFIEKLNELYISGLQLTLIFV